MSRIHLYLLALFLAACTTTSSIRDKSAKLPLGRWALLPFVNQSAKLSPGRWALLPIVNHTDTPQAGLAAEAIIDHLVRARGIKTLERYPATLSKDTLFDPAERKLQEDAKSWAKQQGARYALAGAVNEWRYKVGIDGEPAVGVTLQLIDLANGDIVWSASGGKSGWSREALSSVAQKLLTQLLSTLPSPPPAGH